MKPSSDALTRRRELARLSQGYWWGSITGFAYGWIRGMVWARRRRGRRL